MKTLDELYQLFCDYKKQTGKTVTENSYYYVRRFIEFSKVLCYSECFDKEVYEDWCYRNKGETATTHRNRVAAIRQFMIFINKNGYVKSSIPEMACGSFALTYPKPKRQTDKPFKKSCISDWLEDKRARRK